MDYTKDRSHGMRLIHEHDLDKHFAHRDDGNQGVLTTVIVQDLISEAGYALETVSGLIYPMDHNSARRMTKETRIRELYESHSKEIQKLINHLVEACIQYTKCFMHLFSMCDDVGASKQHNEMMYRIFGKGTEELELEGDADETVADIKFFGVENNVIEHNRHTFFKVPVKFAPQVQEFLNDYEEISLLSYYHHSGEYYPLKEVDDGLAYQHVERFTRSDATLLRQMAKTYDILYDHNIAFGHVNHPVEVALMPERRQGDINSIGDGIAAKARLKSLRAVKEYYTTGEYKILLSRIHDVVRAGCVMLDVDVSLIHALSDAVSTSFTVEVEHSNAKEDHERMGRPEYVKRMLDSHKEATEMIAARHKRIVENKGNVPHLRQMYMLKRAK